MVYVLIEADQSKSMALASVMTREDEILQLQFFKL